MLTTAPLLAGAAPQYPVFAADVICVTPATPWPGSLDEVSATDTWPVPYSQRRLFAVSFAAVGPVPSHSRDAARTRGAAIPARTSAALMQIAAGRP